MATTSSDRFIPREDLLHFAAWSPGDLGSARVAGVGRPSGGSPEHVAEQARSAAAELQAARQAGYQDGYRDGLVALESFKQSFAAQTTAQVGALVASIAAGLEQAQQAMADAVARTAVHLARQVVRAELARDDAVVGTVACEAIDALVRSAKHVTLRVHPDDHALVAAGAAEALEARGARLVADAAVARGGCIVASDLGAVDATVESRWQRAVATVGSREPWHAA